MELRPYCETKSLTCNIHLFTNGDKYPKVARCSNSQVIRLVLIFVSVLKMTVINVGIIGCGEIAQVVHIPTLVFLASKFRISTLCDVSQDSLAHCVAKVPGTNPPKTTTSPAELCASPDVNLVLVINSDEYHAEHGILALQNDKHVLIEKPVALNDRDADALIEAEKKSKGKVMVGYMRRYAAVFADAVREIGGMEKILYVRVRGMLAHPMTWKKLTIQHRHHWRQRHVCGSVGHFPSEI